MKIRTRLTLAFSGLAALVLLVCVFALLALKSANQRLHDHLSGANARALKVTELQHAVDARAIAARNLVLVTRPEDQTAEHAAVLHAHEDVHKRLAELNALLQSSADAGPAERELVARLANIEVRYEKVALSVVGLARSGQRDQAVTLMNDECRPLLAALVQVSEAYAALTVEQAAQLGAQAEAAFDARLRELTGLAVVAVAMALGAGWFVSRRITLPIQRAVVLARAVADGDLTRRIPTDGRDELAELMGALAGMTQQLESLIGQVRTSSEHIQIGAAEVAQGAMDLSQRTERQASALQETASSMEELTGTVRQNADSARQAAALSADAAQVAQRGGAVVADVVNTMQGIDDSSRRIGDILGIIDGIAFQTNILALNAAVEAARAGEQGRGFAVVAGEVRTLAQRSADAARQIKQLIGESMSRVAQGNALVGQAGQTMRGVVEAIDHVQRIVRSISEASDQQHLGVAQLNEAVSQMDASTQQNAALVEQSAAAAASLRIQSDRLVGAMGHFRCSESVSTA